MCTVTFIPNKKGLTFTSNRDEHYKRPASKPPIIHHLHNQDVIYPEDSLAHGTWIAASERGRLACVLNGAFTKHQHMPPYRKSRGLIVLDVFKYKHNQEFINQINLENIEPFTLILVDINKKELFDFRWDGTTKHIKALNFNENYIWSSSTLYSEENIISRQGLFRDFLQNSSVVSAKEIFNFHETGKIGSIEDNLVMKRSNGVQTVSITQIDVIESTLHVRQKNLLTHSNTELSMKLQNISYAE